MGGSSKYRFVKKIIEKRRESAKFIGIDFDAEQERKAREYANYEWKKQNGLLTFSDKINHANTEKELLSTLREKYETPDDFVKGKDLQVLKEMMTTLDSLTEQYPFAQISGLGLTESGIASIDSTGKLNINPEYFEKYGKRTISALNQKERGWFPPNYNYGSLIAHEFGHILHNRYNFNLMCKAFLGKDSGKTSLELFQQRETGGYLKSVEDAALKRLGLTKIEAYKQISGYTVNAEETPSHGSVISVGVFEAIAEAFGDVYTNKGKASKASKVYVDEMLKAVKETEQYAQEFNKGLKK